ncbi:MAG: hypothetical protein JO117_03335 [Verrucomicrobia bacterium]|nr:hypothetical protein [Verrucomicrobiota bacterium]
MIRRQRAACAGLEHEGVAAAWAATGEEGFYRLSAAGDPLGGQWLLHRPSLAGARRWHGVLQLSHSAPPSPNLP